MIQYLIWSQLKKFKQGISPEEAGYLKSDIISTVIIDLLVRRGSSNRVSQIRYCNNCHYQFISEEKWFKQGISNQISYQLSLLIYWWGEVVHTGYLKSDIISTVIINLSMRRSSSHIRYLRSDIILNVIINLSVEEK